jgi:hypothetical protein
MVNQISTPAKNAKIASLLEDKKVAAALLYPSRQNERYNIELRAVLKTEYKSLILLARNTDSIKEEDLDKLVDESFRRICQHLLKHARFNRDISNFKLILKELFLREFSGKVVFPEKRVESPVVVTNITQVVGSSLVKAGTVESGVEEVVLDEEEAVSEGVDSSSDQGDFDKPDESLHLSSLEVASTSTDFEILEPSITEHVELGAIVVEESKDEIDDKYAVLNGADFQYLREKFGLPALKAAFDFYLELSSYAVQKASRKEVDAVRSRYVLEGKKLFLSLGLLLGIDLNWGISDFKKQSTHFNQHFVSANSDFQSVKRAKSQLDAALVTQEENYEKTKQSLAITMSEAEMEAVFAELKLDRRALVSIERQLKTLEPVYQKAQDDNDLYYILSNFVADFIKFIEGRDGKPHFIQFKQAYRAIIRSTPKLIDANSDVFSVLQHIVRKLQAGEYKIMPL